MFARNPLLILFLALLTVAACSDDAEDDAAIKSFTERRDALRERVESTMDQIDDAMEVTTEGADPGMAASQRVQFEDMRARLQEDLDAMEEQTAQTWNDFEADVERGLTDIHDRVEPMMKSMRASGMHQDD